MPRVDPKNRWRPLACGAGLALAALLLACASTTHAQTRLYKHARIHTLDEHNRVVQAFATRDGRIVAVGSHAQVRAQVPAGTPEVDLGGRAVVPGFIENHIHMIRAAEHWSGEFRLDGVSSRREALSRLRRHSASLGPGAWVYTFGGFSPFQFSDAKHPFTAAELDAAAGGRPVYLQIGFQGAFINEAAAQRARLPVPPQKVLFATGATMDRVKQVLLQSLPERGEEGALAITWQAAAYGVTTALDLAGFGIRDAHYVPFEKLAGQCRLPLRLRYTRWFANAPSPFGHGEDVFQRDLASRVPGSGRAFYRLFGAGELLYLPMQDAVGHPGSADPADLAKLESIYLALAAKGWPMKVHAEDAATIGRHLDAIERVHKRHPVDRLHWGFEHGDGITAPLLERMRALNMSLGVHSRPLLASGGTASARPPLRAIHDSGVAYGLGSDAMMVNGFEPLKTIQWAVTGRSLDGSQVTSQRLTPLEALRAHTINNARLIGEDRDLGSIETGKWADFVVLGNDPLAVDETQIGSIPVLEVYLAGTRLDLAKRQVKPRAC